MENFYQLTTASYGTPIAVHKYGNVTKVIRLFDKSINKRKVGTNKNEIELLINTKDISIKQIKELQKAIEQNKEPEDTKLIDIYNKLVDLDKKEIIFHEGELTLLPRPKKHIRLFASGAAEAGKSTFISKFLDNYRILYPDKKIYVFSDVSSDPLLDKHGVTRIKLSTKLVTEPIQTDFLANSMCIFDDIDSITDKKVKKAVLSLYDSILKKGSTHDGIDLIITSHTNTDYQNTRNILINSNFFVIFPHSGGTYQLERMLKLYLGLNDEQKNKILRLPSRWVLIHKHAPNYVMYDKGIYLL